MIEILRNTLFYSIVLLDWLKLRVACFLLLLQLSWTRNIVLQIRYLNCFCCCCYYYCWFFKFVLHTYISISMFSSVLNQFRRILYLVQIHWNVHFSAFSKYIVWLNLFLNISSSFQRFFWAALFTLQAWPFICLHVTIFCFVIL